MNKIMTEEEYYYVAPKNVTISVGYQIRNLLRKYINDKDIAYTIINRIDNVLNYCEDKEFTRNFKQGLQTNKKIK